MVIYHPEDVSHNFQNMVTKLPRCSPAIPREVTNHHQDPGWSHTITRMVTHNPKDGHPPSPSWSSIILEPFQFLSRHWDSDLFWLGLFIETQSFSWGWVGCLTVFLFEQLLHALLPTDSASLPLLYLFGNKPWCILHSTLENLIEG